MIKMGIAEAPRYDPTRRNFLAPGEAFNNTGLSAEHLQWRKNFHNPEFRANLWLNGIEGHSPEPLGIQVFNRFMREGGIELPDNARFDISVNSYGGVAISGLEDAVLTQQIEEFMSYNSKFINSVLAEFMEAARILNGNQSSTSNGLSVEQTRLIRTQSQLMDNGVGIHDLSLGADGRIQGLPQELFDKIYGNRNAIFNDFNRYQLKQVNWQLDMLRDDIIHFLLSGTSHVPTSDISLTFDNGRMIVNL